MNEKPGYKTTEFWTMLVATLLPIAVPGVTPDVAVTISGALAGLYGAYRTWKKK